VNGHTRRRGARVFVCGFRVGVAGRGERVARGEDEDLAQMALGGERRRGEASRGVSR